MTENKAGKQTAGAFDIRNIIGALIGLYGIVLLVVGLVGDPEKSKTGPMTGNANLWAGLVMLVVGIAFIAWARLKPIVVPAHVASEDTASEDTASEDTATKDRADERPAGH